MFQIPAGLLLHNDTLPGSIFAPNIWHIQCFCAIGSVSRVVEMPFPLYSYNHHTTHFDVNMKLTEPWWNIFIWFHGNIFYPFTVTVFLF